MSANEASPFESCKWDDAPLPPLMKEADTTAAQEGVASMIDSPFASSLITPGLMEQLSYSVTAGRQASGEGNKDQAAITSDPLSQHAAAADAHATASASHTASNAAAQPRLQGIASILESPFASTCLSQEAQQLQHINLSGADKAAA
jgi:hypothetical protein